MHNLIQNLRRKPEEERRHILHILTLMFAIIFFVLWAYSLGARISDPSLSKKAKEDIKPFSKLSDDLGATFNTISPDNISSGTSNLDINQ